MANNSALSRQSVPSQQQGSTMANNSALSRQSVPSQQQGSTAANNSALSRQSVPSQQGSTQWQRVKLSSITESEATDSSGSETSRHVRCIKDMKISAQGSSTETERDKNKARVTPLGGDRYMSDISVVGSGMTVVSCNTDTDLAVLYAELQEMEDEGIEDIGELQNTLDEYLGLGVIHLLRLTQISGVDFPILTNWMSPLLFLRGIRNKFLLAHLSQRLIGELIGYPWSGVRGGRCLRRRRCLQQFQTSSLQKRLGQSKPNFM